MRKEIFLFLISLTLGLSFGIFAFTIPAAAQTGINLQNPLNCNTIEECTGKVTDFLLYIAVILVPLMMSVAGFLFITAAGSAEKINQAKKIATWTVIGLLIVLFSKGIVEVISTALGA